MKKEKKKPAPEDPLDAILCGLVGTRDDGTPWVRINEDRHEECGACECGIAYDPDEEDIRACIRLAFSRERAKREKPCASA